MNAKGIVIGGVAGGILLEVLQLLSSTAAAVAMPYDVVSLGAIRAATDPVKI